MYGHTLGAAIGLGYVEAPPGEVLGKIGADEFEIEVAGVRYSAMASLRPMFDPENKRIRN